MTKLLTLTLRCSPKMLTEQLSQQQLYIRLIAKLFKLFRSLSTLPKMLNMSTHRDRRSNLAETRMDKGFDKDAHMSILAEQLRPGKLQGTSDILPQCGTQDLENALVTRTAWGGHLGVVSMVSVVVVGGIFQ